jgi:hypothetical protein
MAKRSSDPKRANETKPLPRPARWTALAAAAAALAALAPSEALAENNPVTGTGKGITGGALLGGEVVTLTMGAVGVDATWAYLVFPVVGAAGGGVGGHFIESDADPEVPVYMLAGGMALLIPTVVVALNATAYQPPADEAEGPASARRVPTSLVDVSADEVAVGVPAVTIAPVYSQREIAQYGVQQAHEVAVPVLHGTF